MVQVAQIGGRGGGEVIWAMPVRKHFFLQEGFPKDNQYVTQAQLLSFHSVSAGGLKAVVGL